jgi:diaminopimelate epimerase
MIIYFTKMHGLGNDFILIDNFNGKIKLTKDQVSLLCNRHTGIGADGLILVESSPKADCFMNYSNADGSKAEMCGNGIRCVASFLKNNYLKGKNVFEIETRSGLKKVTEEAGIFSVNLGKPVFEHPDFPNKKIFLEGLELDFVSLGNPHAVAFVDDLNNFDLKIIGPKIENDKNFKNKINLELVEKKNDTEFKVSVWERGCGTTLACGTGAGAVYSIIRKGKKKEEEIKIILPGGELFISQNKEGEIIMKGEAKSVFSGEVFIE